MQIPLELDDGETQSPDETHAQQPQPLSHAQESRLLLFEDCRSAIDQLFQEANAIQPNIAFGEFLRFAAKFSNLSIYNAMLVRVQRPGAAAVATREKWKDIGRFPKPGASPIVILRAFGPVSFVYELSETEGEPFKEEASNPLFARGMVTDRSYMHLVQSASAYGVRVEESGTQGTLLAGTAEAIDHMPASVTQGGKWNFHVTLNKNHDLATRYATLAHELGHIYCGHCGADSTGRWPYRRKGMSREEVELEAEAVSWLVCSRTGIYTRSAEYLSSLIQKADMRKVSMYAIFDAANRVESRTAPPASKKETT